VRACTHKQDSLVIVYDADCIRQPGVHLFDPEYWRREGGLVGEAEGRGSAHFLETAFAPAVLRKYLRGGQAARFSKDRYLFTGFERSRPVAEFRMLEKLAGDGLPVSEPLAALCSRQGLFYTGWLMTRRIMDALPLADRLGAPGDESSLWGGVGSTIRQFHDHGVVHADLNARNILTGPENRIYLIDFDRARIRPGDKRAFQANLRRLRRSLIKLWPDSSEAGLEDCWTKLLEGYEQGRGRA